MPDLTIDEIGDARTAGKGWAAWLGSNAGPTTYRHVPGTETSVSPCKMDIVTAPHHGVVWDIYRVMLQSPEVLHKPSVIHRWGA